MSSNANNSPTGSECGTCPAAAGSAASPFGPDLQPLPRHWADWSVPEEDDYSPKGELLLSITNGTVGTAEDPLETYTRTHRADYNEIGQLLSSSIQSGEWGGLRREFTYTYNRLDGEYTRIGPDGVETRVSLDEANRIRSFERGGSDDLNDPEDPVMSAVYTYNEIGLLDNGVYGNNTSTFYLYDDALRVTSIDHRNLAGTVRKLVYEYHDNDLVWRITEYDAAGQDATVTFEYDTRGRLISEVRTGSSPYDLSYEYDQGGNRTKKSSVSGDITTDVEYHYDLEAQTTYESFNNRLTYYETYKTDNSSVPPEEEQSSSMAGIPGMEGMGLNQPLIPPFPPPPPPPTGPVLYSTTWYYYNEAGNVTRVATQREDRDLGDPLFTATRFDYAKNGRTVTYVLGEEWNENIFGDLVSTETYAREFRYDSARARYLSRELDPFQAGNRHIYQLSSTWSYYEGDTIYGDFTTAGGVTNLRSYEAGMAKVEPWGSAGDANTQYYHSDMIGTTRHMTLPGGTAVGATVFTAFGEKVGGSTRRYGYAGAYGYQTDETGEFPYLHVGARYYDPATGRFLQRDPIGMQGGTNVYLYVGANPLRFVDPSGLDWIDVIINPIWSVLPPGFHEVVGGGGQIPVLDPGTAQDIVQIGAEIVSLGAGGAAAVGKLSKLNRVRKFIRFERHRIGDLAGGKGTRSLGRITHVNIGKRHVILSPKYWVRRARNFLSCGD